MAPLARHGDLLPLPVPLAENCKLSGFGSRASSRRSHRQYRIHARVTETIKALHFLAGYSTRSDLPFRLLNAAHSMALNQIRRLHTQRKWVSASLPEAALRRLLRHNAATQYAAVGSLASYGEDMVSLPTGSEQPCCLAEILPATWRECSKVLRTQCFCLRQIVTLWPMMRRYHSSGISTRFWQGTRELMLAFSSDSTPLG